MKYLGLIIGAMLIGTGAVARADTALQQMQTARAMYEIGVAQDDPLLILAAAKLRKAIPTDPGTLTPEGGALTEGEPLGWQAMLAAAAPLVAGDPTLEGLAEDIEAERSKGVTNGPVYSIVKIGGGATDTYPSVPFTGGEYAEIYVEGPSGGDLNLLVHDAKGRLVCSDTDISAIAYCGWRPAADGAFTISVVNETGRGGQYSMMTN